MANSRSQLQDALKSRGQAQPKAAAAAGAVASFSDWLFFGQDDSVFVSVTITPGGDYSISYALVLLQTPDAVIICDGAVATSNAGNGWTLNLATGSDTYDVGTYGTTVQAQAFAQVYGVGDVWSPVMTYTVQT